MEIVEAAEIFKALGHPVRAQIVHYLSEHAKCITGDLVQQLPIAQSTTSQHLSVLKTAGIIQGTTEGPSTCYCLAQGFDERLAAAVAHLSSKNEGV